MIPQKANETMERKRIGDVKKKEEKETTCRRIRSAYFHHPRHPRLSQKPTLRQDLKWRNPPALKLDGRVLHQPQRHRHVDHV
jgi:hypothetical protein